MFNIKPGFNRLAVTHWCPDVYGEGFKLADSQDAASSSIQI